MCRERELVYRSLVLDRKAAGDFSQELAAYVQGLEYQMSFKVGHRSEVFRDEIIPMIQLVRMGGGCLHCTDFV